MTTAERFREEGRTQGRAEGEAKGRTEGRAALLLKMLNLKFGPLSAETRARVESASIDELEHWAERVLSATSLDAVFD